MRKLFRFLRGYEKQLVLGPLFKLIEAIFELMVPIVMAKIIDVGVKTQDTAYVYKMGGILVLLGVCGLAFALAAQYFAADAQQGVGTDLRNAMFAHINQLSHAELDKFGTHSLVTRMTNDINQLQNAVAMFIRLVLRAPFLVVGAIVMAISIDLQLSLIFLAVAPLLALVIYFIMSRSVPFFKAMQKRLDKISLIARENLNGARVIRAFAKQTDEEERFEEASSELADTAVRVGRLSALMNPLNIVILNIGIIAIIWAGGWKVSGGRLTQGEVVALVNYMSQILLALVVAANLVVIFTKAGASAARVNEVFDTTASVVSPENGTIAGTEGAPALQFSDVDFSYTATADSVLKDLSFSVLKGETVGIIGGTGSGKSTLVNLVPRLYDVTDGAVCWEGVNVKEYSLKQLRQEIGIVPQQASLVSGTIAENVRWGRKSASDEEVIEALRTAQAWSFVEALPHGINSRVEQGGKNLSGGQRQRLTIARALASHPKLLILDDSSSALDVATDFALRKALREDTAGMTVLIVSQRASALLHADRILVLDDGLLVGSGTHDELLQDCEIYREICISQHVEGVEADA